MRVDFATFCHGGDADRLHTPGQLKKQVDSNRYGFNEVILVYQLCHPRDYGVRHPRDYDTRKFLFPDFPYNLNVCQIWGFDDLLLSFGIDPDKPQYVSDTDKAHTWKHHVVNHIKAIQNTNADYIVFADNDCWMVRQPKSKSWVEHGISVMEQNPLIFIVSPNDGEPERMTRRMSQQMFLTRVSEFRNANFNQPGYTGNPRDYDPIPEYHAMMEGRMEYHCRESGKYRYVLGPEYRYFHHNRLDENGYFDTDYEKLGWV